MNQNEKVENHKLLNIGMKKPDFCGCCKKKKKWNGMESRKKKKKKNLTSSQLSIKNSTNNCDSLLSS